MIPSHLQLFNDLFRNNANLSESSERKHNHNYFMEMISVDGMYDSMMYVGKWRPPPTVEESIVYNLTLKFQYWVFKGQAVHMSYDMNRIQP